VRIHKIGADEFDRPYRAIPVPLRRGSWTWTGRCAGKRTAIWLQHCGVERVSVPYGTFSAHRFRAIRDASNCRTDLWVVDGLGVVKVYSELPGLFGPLKEFTWELTAFSKRR